MNWPSGLLRIGRKITDWSKGTPGGLVPIPGATVTDSGASLGITPPAGGVNIALSSAAVWACCRLVSTSIGTLPAHVFEETADGKVKAYKHPYYRLLTKKPNPYMTLPQWIQTTVLHLMLYGNSYTWLDRIGGEVVGLYPLQPDRVEILGQADGSLVYRYRDNGRITNFTDADIIHFRVFTLDGITGLSPIDYHRMTFDFEAASQLYAASLYKNGGRPSGVLEYPGVLQKDQVDRIRESWQQIHGGPAGFGKVAVLENGTKYAAISVPLDQLEYISSQKFSVEQIARIYGVAPHLIGSMDKPTYASVEQQSLEFLRYTIQPIVISLERELEAALLEPPFMFRFNLNGFERSDISSRYRAYATGRQWGFLSVNDIRELEDMNRIGDQGDVYLQPLNMVPAGEYAGEVGTGAVQE
jgi:HK97 family phage portal protein